MLFKDLQKLVSQSQQQKENTHKELFQRLQGKPFWIWNIIEHKQQDIKTEIAAIAKNLLRIDGVLYELIMSHNKKEIEIPGESTEEAKELEIDEQPKPTRKVSHPATPMSNKEEPSTHDKIKGRRTIK